MTLGENLARVAHRAVRAGYRLEEVRRMTVRQLVAVSTLESEIEREAIRSNAVASRIAQADKKGWNRSMKELDPAPAAPRRSQVVDQAAGSDEIDPGNSFHMIPEDE